MDRRASYVDSGLPHLAAGELELSGGAELLTATPGGIIAAGLIHGPVAIVIARREKGGMRLLQANDAFSRLTRYPLEQVKGRYCDFLRGPETAADVSETIDNAYRHDLFIDVEVLHYRSDGSHFWNGITVIPVPAAGAGTTLILMRDVTARRRGGDRMTVLADRLRDMAMSDPLTGIANRRCFDAALLRVWRRAERSGSQVALAIVDIDHFKRYNDLHGHPVGDSCLCAVATILNDVVRAPTDLVARYGGEEFAVLMPDTGAAEAGWIAERMVDAVRLANQDGVACPTISCGVIVARPGTAGTQLSRFIAGADIALYTAKENGRDCVHVAASI